MRKHIKKNSYNLFYNKGLTLKNMGATEHYWKKNREQWECKNDTHHTPLKSGTIVKICIT